MLIACSCDFIFIYLKIAKDHMDYSIVYLYLFTNYLTVYNHNIIRHILFRRYNVRFIHSPNLIYKDIKFSKSKVISNEKSLSKSLYTKHFFMIFDVGQDISSNIHPHVSHI